jgi:Kdo2-lipid IVA lauroyltransferase/acyltransferase
VSELSGRWPHRFQYTLFRMLEVSLSRFGWRAQTRFGRAAGRLWYRVDAPHRRLARRNVRSAFPEWSANRVDELVRANFEHLGITAAEFVGLASSSRADLFRRTRLEGLSHLEEARALGKGVLLLGGHLGNWEFAGVAMALRGYSVSAIGRRLNNPWVDRRVTLLRERFGGRIIPHRRAVGQVMRALARGEFVGFLMDQRALQKEAVESRFFGRPVATNQGLALLALKTGAPVVPAIGERVEGGHVLRYLPALPPPESGSREERVRQYTEMFDGALEAAVRRRPEQWFWLHDRWRVPW